MDASRVGFRGSVGLRFKNSNMVSSYNFPSSNRSIYRPKAASRSRSVTVFSAFSRQTRHRLAQSQFKVVGFANNALMTFNLSGA
jgi:hypothetical protein